MTGQLYDIVFLLSDDGTLGDLVSLDRGGKQCHSELVDKFRSSGVLSFMRSRVSSFAVPGIDFSMGDDYEWELVRQEGYIRDRDKVIRITYRCFGGSHTS